MSGFGFHGTGGGAATTFRGPGMTEAQLAQLSGLRYVSYSTVLASNPNYWVSAQIPPFTTETNNGVVGGSFLSQDTPNVVAIPDGLQDTFRPIHPRVFSSKGATTLLGGLFPVPLSLLDPVAPVGCSATPCIMFTTGYADGSQGSLTDGANSKWFQFRIRGRNIFGQPVEETTPVMIIPSSVANQAGVAVPVVASTGTDTWTFITWLTTPMTWVDSIEYRGRATASSSDRFSIGYYHPIRHSNNLAINTEELQFADLRLGRQTPAGRGEASAPSSPTNISILGQSFANRSDLFNYGIELPFEVEGRYDRNPVGSNIVDAPLDITAKTVITSGSIVNLSRLGIGVSASIVTLLNAAIAAVRDGADLAEIQTTLTALGALAVPTRNDVTVSAFGPYLGAPNRVWSDGSPTAGDDGLVIAASPTLDPLSALNATNGAKDVQDSLVQGPIGGFLINPSSSTWQNKSSRRMWISGRGLLNDFASTGSYCPIVPMTGSDIPASGAELLLTVNGYTNAGTGAAKSYPY